MMSFVRSSFLSLIFGLALTGQAWAASTLVWTGAVSDDWSVGLNWDQGFAPSAGDTAVFSGMPVNACTANSDINVGNLLLDGTFLSTLQLGPGVNATLGDLQVMAGTFNAGPGQLMVNGSWTQSGGMVIASTTLNTAGGDFVVTGGNFMHNNGQLRFNGSGAQQLSPGASELYHVQVNSIGTLTLIGNMQVSGNWELISGTVNPGSSTVILSGPNQVLTGNLDFNDLRHSAPAPATLTLAGNLQLSGNLELLGGPGALLTLNSSIGGVQRSINVAGTVNAQYLDIRDSALSPGGTANDSVDSGNNTGWSILAPTTPTFTATPSQTATPSPGPTAIAVTFTDASAGENGGGASTLIFSHTVGSGSNRILIVGAAVNTTTNLITSVEYAGQSLTLFSENQAASTMRSSIWYLLQPPIGTSNVTITSSTAPRMAGVAASYANVRQASPLGAVVTDSSTSTTSAFVSVSKTNLNSLIFAHLACTDAAVPVPEPGQNDRGTGMSSGGGSATTKATSTGSDKGGPIAPTTFGWSFGFRAFVVQAFEIFPYVPPTPTRTQTATRSPTRSATATRSATMTPSPTPPPLAPVFGHTSYGGGSYHSLNAPGLKTSARFAQRGNKNLDEFGVHIMSLNGLPPQYRYSLYPDNGFGEPGATPLRTLTSAVAAGWNSFGISPVALVDGAIYHVVVEPDSTPPDGLNYIDVFFQFGAQAWTIDQVYDPILRGGTGSGGSWSFGGAGPVVLLHYDDASVDGGSFRTFSGAGAYDVYRAAQRFKAPAGGAWVSRLGTQFQKTGSPLDALYYRIYNVTQASLVSTGTFSTPAAAPVSSAWFDVNLPSPVFLNGSDEYRIEFYSPASTVGNGYSMLTAFTGGGPTVLHDYTYGGSASALESSTDGGSSFSPDRGQDLYFRFNQGLVPLPTATPTRTATPCTLVVSGPLTLTAGTYNGYCDVIVQAGGQLFIQGQVILNVSGSLQVAAGGSIIGDGGGWQGPGIQSNGNGPGAGGMGNGAGGAGGGGHGGIGGNGSNYLNGGIAYGSAALSNQQGSSGGSGNTGLGGDGGAALIVTAGGNATLDGQIRMNGMAGGDGGSSSLSSGGGGAGGSVHISALNILGSGSLEARGGDGGDSSCGTASCWGGGGGGGGRVNLCASGSYSYAGTVDVLGGASGASGPAMPQAGGQGSFFLCAINAATPTPTASPSPTVTPTPTPASLAGWQYYLPITVSNSSGAALPDYTVLVRCGVPGSFFSAVRGDGADIRFADASGTVLYDFELSAFNTGSSLLEAWVRIPDLPTGVSTIRLYYGNPGAAAFASGPVWPGALGVYHFNEAAGSSFLDSSGSGNHGSLSAPPVWTSGLSAGGASFNGTQRGLIAANPGIDALNSSFTLSAWVKASATGLMYLAAREQFSSARYALYLGSNTVIGSVNGVVRNSGLDAPAGTTWYMASATYNGSQLTVLRDGLNGGSVLASVPAGSTNPLVIGAFDTAGTNGFQGVMDELRIWPGPRSQPALMADYEIQRCNWISVGSQVTLFTHTPTATATRTDSPTGTATPTATPTDSPTGTATPSASPTGSPTGTATGTGTPTPSSSPTQTRSATGSPTMTATVTPTQTPTATPSASPSGTQSPSPTVSPSFTAVPAATWFSCNWPWRKALTAQGSQISGTHPDFPLYVELVDPDLQSRARSDGFDLLFTDHDGATQLPHEIESWDPGTGTLKAWVKVPVLDHGVDRKLYLYYGYAASSNQQFPHGVWSSGFAGVWHLNADGTDSNSLGRHGTNNGAVPIAGQLAGAHDFNSAHFDTGTWNPGGPGLTLEGWVWFDNILGADGRVISKATGDQDDDHVFMLSNLADKARLRVKTGASDASGTAVLTGAQTLLNNRWYHLAATFDGSLMRLYVDGVLDAEAVHPSPGTLRSNSWSVWIGDNPAGLSVAHNGRLDEVRVAGLARSTGWIATQFNNQSAPAVFVIAGSQELSGCATPTPTVTETATMSPSPTASPSETATSTSSTTASATPSPTLTPTETATQTQTATLTASTTVTATATPSRSSTMSPTGTPSKSSTPTASTTASASPSATLTPTASPTVSWSATRTPTPSVTASASPTASRTPMPSFTQTSDVSPTPSFTITPTYSVSNTPQPTQTPQAPAVLSRNVWRPALGQPLHIGIKAPQTGKVRVRVFNVAAEMVRQPFDADVPADVTVDAVWDGKNEAGEPCGAGIYLVSVQGAGISKVLKVVLLK